MTTVSPRSTRLLSRWSALALLSVTLAACSTGGGGGASPAGHSARSPSPTASAPLPPCTNTSSVPAAPGGPVTSSPLWTIATGLNEPDDLLFHGGQLYVGELGAGAVDVMAPGKPSQRLPVSIPLTEGMAFIGST